MAARNSDPDAFWPLGCLAGLAFVGFFIWLIFIRQPDPEFREQVAADIDRQQELEQTRLENARTACNSGVRSACVEYAEMID